MNKSECMWESYTVERGHIMSTSLSIKYMGF